MASPDPDRARALGALLVADVRAAAWALARYDSDGDLCEFIAEPQDLESPLTAESVESETALQRRDGASAPAVFATKISLAPLRFGLTALYGRRTRIVGTLVLARSASDGTFTIAERATLTNALERATEDLQRMSAFEGEEAALSHVTHRSSPAQYVLNDLFEIEYRWCPPEDDTDVVGAMLRADERLPPAVDRTVREIVSRWSDDPATWQETVVLPLPFVVVRVFPFVRDAKDRRIGVHVERYQARNALRMAVSRFQLSRREVEVLSLLLQGRGSIEIAHSLDIAESTVNDHIKRLMGKTRARNRVDLAAKALGWRAPSPSGNP
ncbi:MAG TPA: helix-turn-helix transcriptional regulator [Candidatus Acidoferrales bacterium]|nr:helix-turn-helix transcriptional regulator [Candidatus Acidoferrales bacterium]